MLHQVKVFDAKGKLKQIISPQMLQERSDAMLKKAAGPYGKSFRIGNKPKKRTSET